MAIITVLLPVFNGENYLHESINSILNQSYRDLELIVVNDGSTDRTLEVLSRFNDKRLKLISLPVNRGAAYATQVGWDASDSRYVALMDHDDIARHQRIEKQIILMNGQPKVAASGGQMQCFGAANSVLTYPIKDGHIKANLLTGTSNFANPTMIIRRQAIDKIGLNWKSEWQSIFDWAFWSEMMLAGATFRNHPDILLDYRAHDNQQSKDQSLMRDLKAKLRLKIMTVLFPTLSENELILLEPLLQWISPPPLQREALESGLRLIPKAKKVKTNALGEDRTTINEFLHACEQRWTNALKQ